jgi:hypothetical protein
MGFFFTTEAIAVIPLFRYQKSRGRSVRVPTIESHDRICAAAHTASLLAKPAACSRESCAGALPGSVRAARTKRRSSRRDRRAVRAGSPDQTHGVVARQSVYIPSAAPSDSFGNIDIAFEITKDGRAQGIEIVDATPNRTDEEKHNVFRWLRDGLYRPRAANGAIADGSRVVWRHYWRDGHCYDELYWGDRHFLCHDDVPSPERSFRSRDRRRWRAAVMRRIGITRAWHACCLLTYKSQRSGKRLWLGYVVAGSHDRVARRVALGAIEDECTQASAKGDRRDRRLK